MRVLLSGSGVGLGPDAAGETNAAIQAIGRLLQSRGHETVPSGAHIAFLVGVARKSDLASELGVFTWEVREKPIHHRIRWKDLSGEEVQLQVGTTALGIAQASAFLDRVESQWRGERVPRLYEARATVLVDHLGWILDRRREELVEYLTRVVGERDRALERIEILERELTSLRSATREPDDAQRRWLTGSVAAVIVAVLGVVGSLGAAAVNADGQRDAAHIAVEGEAAASDPSGPSISQTLDLAQEIVELCQSASP